MMNNENNKEEINDEFKKMFGDYYYPYKTSNEIIDKLAPANKTKYFKEAGRIKESDVFRQEINEATRYFYKKLAIEAKDDYERAFYKGALLFLSDFYKRLNSLANRDPLETQKAVNEANKIIDNLLLNK